MPRNYAIHNKTEFGLHTNILKDSYFQPYPLSIENMVIYFTDTYAVDLHKMTRSRHLLLCKPKNTLGNVECQSQYLLEIFETGKMSETKQGNIKKWQHHRCSFWLNLLTRRNGQQQDWDKMSIQADWHILHVTDNGLYLPSFTTVATFNHRTTQYCMCINVTR